ncbi:MAG: hypothetical protein JWO25_2608 [Alphaproteobacteria bacterium]|nr:hypothetical protein [Alphaproteobacteria bacterium]
MKSTLLFGMAALSATMAGTGPAAAQPASLAARAISPRAGFGTPDFQAVGRPFSFGSGQRHGRGRGFGRGANYWGGGLWNEGYEDPAVLRDAGFFAGPAQAFSDGNRVHYDYDRGYPYDWYRPSRTALPMATVGNGRARRISCNVETAGVRVCRGGR